jgi:hypothetical protein
MEPVEPVTEQPKETLRRRRAELHESIIALEQALAASAPGRADAWAERVRVALVELSADLREHIDITEGSHGVYRGVLGTAPRLANAVAELTREHAEIRTLVDSLLACVSGSQTDTKVDQVRAFGTALLQRLLDHRQHDSDLVYEAYEADIGGET